MEQNNELFAQLSQMAGATVAKEEVRISSIPVSEKVGDKYLPQDNIYISNAEMEESTMSDKPKVLSITFEKRALTADNRFVTSNRSKVFVYNPIQKEGYGGVVKTCNDLIDDMNKYHRFIIHIAKAFTTNEDVLKTLNVFSNLGVDVNTIATQVANNDLGAIQSYIGVAYSSCSQWLVNLLNAPEVDTDVPLRVKFRRSSENNHYPKLPNYLTFWKPAGEARKEIVTPFIAKMADIAAREAIYYSKYDLGERNSGVSSYNIADGSPTPETNADTPNNTDANAFNQFGSAGDTPAEPVPAATGNIFQNMG